MLVAALCWLTGMTLAFLYDIEFLAVVLFSTCLWCLFVSWSSKVESRRSSWRLRLYSFHLYFPLARFLFFLFLYLGPFFSCSHSLFFSFLLYIPLISSPFFLLFISLSFLFCFQFFQIFFSPALSSLFLFFSFSLLFSFVLSPVIFSLP